MTVKETSKDIKSAPTFQQEAQIKRATEYITEQTKPVLSEIGAYTTAMRLDAESHLHNTPLGKASLSLDRILGEMTKDIIGYNEDTTLTEDAVSLRQGDKVEAKTNEAFAMINTYKAEAEDAVKGISKNLFSNKLDESPVALAMIGNTELLRMMREDFTQFTGDEHTAKALNAFRIYGLLDKQVAHHLPQILNEKHSPKAVEAIRYYESQIAALNTIERQIKGIQQMLMKDPKKLAGIRSRRRAV